MDLKEKISKGIITLKKNANGKSRIWEIFEVLYEEDTKTGHVQCSHCKVILKWNPKIGSSHLSRHRCAIMNSPKSLPKNKIFPYITRNNNKDIKKIRNQINESLVFWIGKDATRLFDIIEGEGYCHHAQTLLNLGARYGKILIKDILPDFATMNGYTETETTKETVLDKNENMPTSDKS